MPLLFLILAVQSQTVSLDSNTIKTYLEIAAIIILWLFSLYRTKVQVDGFGERMKVYEEKQAVIVGQIASIEKQQLEAGLDRKQLHEKFGEIRQITVGCNASIDDVADDIREVMEAMGKAQTEKQHQLELKFENLKTQFDTIERMRKEGRLNA